MAQPRALMWRSAQHLHNIREETSLANASPTERRLHSWLMALRAPWPCLHGGPSTSPPLQPRAHAHSLSPFSFFLPPQSPIIAAHTPAQLFPAVTLLQPHQPLIPAFLHPLQCAAASPATDSYLFIPSTVH